VIKLLARQLRAGIVPALPLVVAALCFAPAQAQIMPPRGGGSSGGPPPGGFQGRMPGTGGPVIERVWTCGKCGREIGRGAFPPGQCPYCGVKLINGVGPADPQYNNGNQPPPNNGGQMPPNNPNPGMMPPNQQNSGMMPPNNQNSGMMPGRPQNGQNGPPPGGFQANPADVPPPAAGAFPPGGDDQPALEEGPPPFGDNAAAGGPRVVTTSPTGSGSRLSVGVRVLIGLAALVAALVLVVVGALVVYNVVSANSQEGGGRPRKRRRLAEVD
jgi:hypothetical protein